MLTIVDPIDPINDIGRGAHNALSIKSAFAGASSLLRVLIKSENESTDAFSEKFHCSPILSSVLPITPQETFNRELALRNFLLSRPNQRVL